MDYFDFVEKYKPIENHIEEHGYNNTMFETYGEELEFVLSQPKDRIWTLVDGEDYPVITNGYHLVNRLGYFITKVPCEEEFVEIIDD